MIRGSAQPGSKAGLTLAIDNIMRYFMGNRVNGNKYALLPILKTGDSALLRVETRDAPKTEYEGRLYYFESAECKRAFEDNPRRYTSGEAK